MTVAQRVPRQWTVEIATGANAGALVALPPGRHRFGQHRDNDVVLADAGVAPRHGVLEIAAGSAFFESLAPGVRLRDRPLAEGARRPLRDGAEIMLGGTCLRLRGPSRRRPGWMRLPALSAGLAATAAAALAMAPVHPATPQVLASADAVAIGAAFLSHDAAMPGGAQPTSAARPMPAAPSAAEAGRSLRAQLAESGLGDAVKVTAADGAVLATGALLPGDRDRWLATQMWFDAANGGRVALIDKVGVARAEDLPHLDIRAASVGAVPFVVTGSGDRYTEGSVLPGGWMIAHIGADRVTLRNGARSMDITL